MDEVTVKAATPAQAQKIYDWSRPFLERDKLLIRPFASVLCAAVNEDPQMFAILQPAMIIESLAPNPQSSDFTLCRALLKIMQTVQMQGWPEIYTLTGPNDQRLERLAAHYGFTKLPWTAWRKENG